MIWSFVPLHEGEEDEDPVSLEIASSNEAEIAERLLAGGFVESPLLMEIYLRFFVLGGEAAPRAHFLRRGLSPRQLAQHLYELGSRQTVKVTLIEGWDYLRVAEALEVARVASHLAFEAAVTEQELLAELSISGDSAEGYLFPATYEFHLDSDPRQIVSRLAKETRRRLTVLRGSQSPHPDLASLSMNEREVLTLASIVEKETSHSTEQPRVARVFLNRLLRPDDETGGRLQSDPTAGYGCKVDPMGAPSCAEYKGRISGKMLKDAGNRYNSYRHPGLPPGPICSPGEGAIAGVLRPAEGEELYFVANGKGGHTFSVKYDDHLRAIEALRAIRGGPPQ
jgi:UPF0755 protein